MKHRKKGDLPSKVCATCGLPFTWRKKWERNWEEVRHCSEKCRRNRKHDPGAADPAQRAKLGGG